QPLIVLGPRTLRRCLPRVVATGVDLHHLAHAPHAVFMLVALDERVPHPDCLAKYAALDSTRRCNTFDTSVQRGRYSWRDWDVPDCRMRSGESWGSDGRQGMPSAPSVVHCSSTLGGCMGCSRWAAASTARRANGPPQP